MSTVLIYNLKKKKNEFIQEKKSLQGIQWQMHQIKKKNVKVVIFMQT